MQAGKPSAETAAQLLQLSDAHEFSMLLQASFTQTSQHHSRMPHEYVSLLCLRHKT
jgi:hypothetical protein